MDLTKRPEAKSELPVINMDFLKEHPLSYSKLKHFKNSPRHYLWALLKPYEPPSEPMKVGIIVDCLLLTPEEYDNKFYIIKEDINRRTKEGRLEYEEELKKAEGKTVITKQQREDANWCIEAIMEHPIAGKLIENKQTVQRDLRWTDSNTKLPCRGYVDFDTTFERQSFYVDLKKSISADPDDFMKSVLNFDYGLQMAMYSDGYHKSLFQFPSPLWIVFEEKEPFAVSVIQMDKKDLDFFKEEFFGMLVAFKYCMDNNLWHQGYEFLLYGTRPFHTPRLPGWKKAKFGI